VNNTATTPAVATTIAESGGMGGPSVVITAAPHANSTTVAASGHSNGSGTLKVSSGRFMSALGVVGVVVALGRL